MAAKKILIIEDDTYIRELYEDIFKEKGFVIDSAVDGEEGLVKIKGGAYNLILLDIMLPKVDGLGVLKELKHAKINHGPIVLLTNLGHDPIVKEGVNLGAVAYLIKSDLTPDQLIEKVIPLLK